MGWICRFLQEKRGPSGKKPTLKQQQGAVCGEQWTSSSPALGRHPARSCSGLLASDHHLLLLAIPWGSTKGISSPAAPRAEAEPTHPPPPTSRAPSLSREPPLKLMSFKEGLMKGTAAVVVTAPLLQEQSRSTWV